MASELGVQTIQHTNGTDALTIDSSGYADSSKSSVCVVRLANQINTSANAENKITYDTRVDDPNSWFDITTNHRFQPTVAGHYHIQATTRLNGETDFDIYDLIVRKNGSGSDEFRFSANQRRYTSNTCSTIFSMNGSTDYVEVYVNFGTNLPIRANKNETCFIAHRILG